VRVLQVRRRRYLELTKLDCQVLLVALDSFAMDLRSDIAADSPFDAEYTFKHIANLREAVMICGYGRKAQSPMSSVSTPSEDASSGEAKTK